MEWKERVEKVIQTISKSETLPNWQKHLTLVFLDSLIRLGFENTFRHVINVTMICLQTAENLRLGDVSRFANAGAIHDIGKIDLSPGLFDGSRKITPQIFHEEIKPHVFKGYGKLRDIDPFDAWVAIAHHTNAVNGYGLSLETSQSLAVSDFIRAGIKSEASFRPLAMAIKLVKISDYAERNLNCHFELLDKTGVGKTIEETLNLRNPGCEKIIQEVLKVRGTCQD